MCCLIERDVFFGAHLTEQSPGASSHNRTIGDCIFGLSSARASAMSNADICHEAKLRFSNPLLHSESRQMLFHGPMTLVGSLRPGLSYKPWNPSAR